MVCRYWGLSEELKKTPLKASFYYFPPEELFLLKSSPDHKMIKLLSFDVIYQT